MRSGAYAFPSLSPGPYRLQAALQGFRTFAQSDIVLQVGGELRHRSGARDGPAR